MVDSVLKEIKRMKEFAKDNNVPIMQEDGINYLTTFIIKHKITSILEVGTAIGYSAILMVLTNKNVKVTTIERDENRYLEALRNVKKLGLEDRITLIFKDAKDVTLDDNFDLIFIDAAKGQNKAFFEKFSFNLNPKGFIITDNMNFHGLVLEDEANIPSRNLRGLIHKIKAYKVFLEDNEEFVTQFYDVGDGIAVSQRV